MTGTLERLRGTTRDVFLPALSDSDLEAALSTVWALEQELTALRLAIVREVSCRNIPRRQGAAETSTWLADKLFLSYRAAASMVRLADALDSAAPGTREALTSGEINVDQATIVADAVRKLPDPVRAEGETHMLNLAREFTPPQLRKLAAHLQDVVDPDGAEARSRDAFARQERRNTARGITLTHTDGDDLWQLRGQMNAETAAIIRAAIDPLCNPRRHRNPLTPEQPPSPDTPPNQPPPTPHHPTPPPPHQPTQPHPRLRPHPRLSPHPHPHPDPRPHPRLRPRPGP